MLLRSKFSSGSFICQYAATLTATIALVSSGMHFGWPSPSLPLLLEEDSETHVTHAEGSWLAVMPSIGAAFGAILGGVLVDIIGRKSCILILSPVYFVAWMAIAYVPNIICFYVARFAVGTADGIAFTVFPMYLCEIADSRIRGLLGSSIQITITMGLLLINLVGLHFPIKETALISAALPVIHFITFIWMPESPYFLIFKGRHEKASASLRTLMQLDDVDDEISRLNTAINEDKESFGSIMDLLTISSNRNALLVVCILRFLQQLTGNFAIAFYCQMIFREAGGLVTPGTSTIIYFAGQLIVSIISSIFVDKVGRKPLLIVSAIGSGITLFAEGAYFYIRNETSIDLSSFSYVPLVAFLLYIIMYNVGLCTIPTVLLGEVFPTSIRAFALCIADIVFSLSVASVSKFFQFTKDEFGIYVPFFSFTVGAVIVLLFVIFCVPETKGKTLEEVQVMFKSKSTIAIHENPEAGVSESKTPLPN